MNAKDAIRQVVEFSHMVAGAYLRDLTDEQLLERPTPGANHIAWQLGHLISGDSQMLAMLGHVAPELPPGFTEMYTKETAPSDDAAKFHKLSDYLGLMDQGKAAVLAAIDATPDERLDEPTPEEMHEYAPNVAAGLTVLGTHWLMHAGQWVVVRRKLGMPAMF